MIYTTAFCALIPELREFQIRWYIILAPGFLIALLRLQTGYNLRPIIDRLFFRFRHIWNGRDSSIFSPIQAHLNRYDLIGMTNFVYHIWTPPPTSIYFSGFSWSFLSNNAYGATRPDNPQTERAASVCQKRKSAGWFRRRFAEAVSPRQKPVFKISLFLSVYG